MQAKVYPYIAFKILEWSPPSVLKEFVEVIEPVKEYVDVVSKLAAGLGDGSYTMAGVEVIVQRFIESKDYIHQPTI